MKNTTARYTTMRKLLVFYSRTGTTRKVAQEIAKSIGADVEELIDLEKRKGPLGLVRSIRDAIRKTKASLQRIEKDPSAYDLVVIGSPVWGRNLSSPVRTYIDNNKKLLKKIALFCTSAGESKLYASNCLNALEELTGQKAVAFLGLDRNDIKKGFTAKIASFISVIQNPQQRN
jgi:flavodoxin